MDVNRQSATKPIKGFEHRYTISTDRVITDLITNKIIKESNSRVKLIGNNNKVYTIDVNKLLHLTFTEIYDFTDYEEVIGEPTYIINKLGALYSTKRKKFIKQQLKNGYLRYAKLNGERLVHRLLAKQYIPNPDNLETVNHIDGNKLNNDINNLEWLSKEDNVKHSWLTGLKKAYKSVAVEFIDVDNKPFVAIGLHSAGNIFGIKAPTICTLIKLYGNTGKRIPSGKLQGYLINTKIGRFIDYPEKEYRQVPGSGRHPEQG
jgi:hypothetical protein